MVLNYLVNTICRKKDFDKQEFREELTETDETKWNGVGV